MRKNLKVKVDNSGAGQTTLLVLYGTLIAFFVLGILLLVYNGVVHSIWFVRCVWIVATIFAYLLTAERIHHKNRKRIVNWMLIAFYVFLAFCALLFWGINAPIGILTVSFTVILSSILMGARSILPVTIVSILVLISVQIVHSSKVVLPNLKHLSLESTFWDVVTYSTILSVFALVSWLAGNQKEKSLKRALLAEAALKSQKDTLAAELEKESAALRLAQLNQVRHLHKFALLGQSTAATLHELSNHLSVLNLDIDDLRQHHSNSKAIANAKDSINHINKMVRQARQHLNSFDQRESFDAIAVIHRSADDLSGRFLHHHIKFHTRLTDGRSSFIVTGSSPALMQIIAILLNNAFDAVQDARAPRVTLKIKNTKSKLHVSVVDNGKGISPDLAGSLFNPVKSTKTGGLGVGLYIAQHLAKDQFDGKIDLLPSKNGAHFAVTIPAKKSATSQ